MENSNLTLMEVLEAQLIHNSHLDMMDEKRIKQDSTHEDYVLMDKKYFVKNQGWIMLKKN